MMFFLFMFFFNYIFLIIFFAIILHLKHALNQASIVNMSFKFQKTF